MIKKYLYIVFVLTFTATSIFAQKHDYVWTFGYGKTFPNGGTNINFNFNPPDTDYIKRDLYFDVNSASISDAKGRLLFYTNGCKIFNLKNKLIKNGDNLNPGFISSNYCNYGSRMAQGSIFLPHPSDTSLYYLFHLGPEFVMQNELGGISDKIYYTLLDKNGDNKNGEVLSKNNVIHEDTIAFGKMTTVRHGNGRDWWIIVPRMLQNRYIKFLFTDKEIKGPFIQDIGLENKDDNGTGQAVFSPDGSKYIHFDRYNDLNIFDFDRCTGELSNFKNVVLPTAKDSITHKNKKYPLYTVGGVAVSPNSKFLYVTTELDVFQYNFQSLNMVKDVKIVAKNDSFSYNGFWTSFYLPHIAPDGKIYINCTNGSFFLHVINNPDEEGIACNLTQHSFRLPTYNAFSIPNFPNFRLGKIDKPTCETPIATKDGALNEVDFKVFQNPSNGLLTLNYKSEIQSNVIWELYNSLGILQYKQIVQNADNQENIELGNLLDGMYFWHLKSNEKLLKSGKLLLLK